MNVSVGSLRLSPTEDIVCHCKEVTRSDIEQALEAAGGDLEAAKLATGAGSVCGGCTPLISQIAGQDTMQRARLVEKHQLDDAHWRLVFRLDTAVDPGPAAQDVALDVSIGANTHTRSYTATRLEGRELEITVRREANGLVSRWLCDDAGYDDDMQASAPFGGLTFSADEHPVFLAAGIGITPALSFARAQPEAAARVYWWARGALSPGLIAHVQECLRGTRTDLTLMDTSDGATRLAGSEAADWLRAQLTPHEHVPHICGPQGFLDSAVRGLDALDWPKDRRRVASFLYAPGQGVDAEEKALHRIDSFKLPVDAIVTPSFALREAQGFAKKQQEARSFLRQFYHEIGAEQPFEDRFLDVSRALRKDGSYAHTSEELAYGARLAWRNSNRCIGRFFWQSLTVRDKRDLPEDLKGEALARAVFDHLVDHIAFGTNGGDIRPSISIFPPERGIFIENPQLILYAGHEQSDGSVIGDPKSVSLTKKAKGLGWRGEGTPFDILPVMVTIGGEETFAFDLPQGAVTEVEITHPEEAAVSSLGLKWFALPAVANMALDLGGVVYEAAPSNGFYMGTEIGSFNLADPRRYDRLADVAEALRLKTGDENPLWRDQALTELNRAVLHSFNKAGVRMLDHHAMSNWFDRFRATENERGRPIFGHWPWIVPPMSSNLSNVWHDASLKNVILKPGYFYPKQSS